MLDEHVNITLAGCGFQAVEDVAEILAQIILNERAGFQLKCAEITDVAQLCGKVDFHKVPGNFRLGKKLPECCIMGRGGVLLLFHWLIACVYYLCLYYHECPLN